MYTKQIVSEIRKTNPQRSSETVQRRLIKVLEELGEASEAYLSRTSEMNYKSKTWTDYREEAVDILIILLDIGLTQYPNGSFPAGAMLELNVEEGRENASNDFTEMERLKFEIARAVCSAEYYFNNKEAESGFVGAIGRGVRAAASMCYAKVPDQRNEGIDDLVFSLVEKKLEKWRGAMARSATPIEPASTPLTKPETEVMGQTEFFQNYRDRQL